MKSLPIGIQDFKQLIEENHLYIDKTKYIYDLAKTYIPYFISRPRRFGKSLTISKLYYLFKGEKELFKDTWIYDKWEWKEYPVIRLNINEVKSTTIKDLEYDLNYLLNKIAKEYDLELYNGTLNTQFDDLIYQLHKKTGEKVVVLIDEYEKPILDTLFDKQKAEEIRTVFRDFYGILKSNDDKLRFLLLTGITKFTKTGVFSTLNHLNELTIDKRYSEMFGYTQEELEHYFKDYIEKAIKQLKISKEELLKQIKDYYNGFSFDGIHKVYNPFSILNFFDKLEFQNYWIESGSPNFLINYAKKNKIEITEILNKPIKPSLLTTYEIEQAPPISFLLQAGYLTFKSVSKRNTYTIDYPNNEVRESFSEILLLSTYNLNQQSANEVRENIEEGFETRNFNKIFEELKRVFSNIPSNLYETKKETEDEVIFIRRQESYYHAVILTTLYSIGIKVKAEESTNLGRSDIVIEYENDIYIIEIKKDKSEKALHQIKEKGYHNKYKGKNIYLIGIEIDDKIRNLKEYIIEKTNEQ